MARRFKRKSGKRFVLIGKSLTYGTTRKIGSYKTRAEAETMRGLEMLEPTDEVVKFKIVKR